jgi:hypothetical protein
LLGLVINQRPNVSRTDRKRIEAVLTNVLKHGLDSQNRERRDPQFLQSLGGKVAWVEQINPAHGRKLSRLLAACDAAISDR